MEYYVVRPIRLEGSHRNAYELIKYNPNNMVTGRGHVFEHEDGSFTSDDYGFQKHGNEHVSRRIRIVKKFKEDGEMSHSVFWFNGGNIECYRI